MSDYTDFTYLDYQYSDAGQRQADSDAIAREFSKYGASYYGNGSEFIVGYDANGGAMVDSDAVRAAARRKAEEAESSRRAEEALMRLIAKNASAHHASTYLELDREVVCFPYRGKVSGMQLVHRSGMNCRYAFSPARVGPFPTYMHGLGEISEIRVDKTYPCPFCFAGTPIMDDLEKSDAERVRSVRRALRTNQWREECYMSGADSKPSVTNNVQLEESKLFTPYSSYVKTMGANPDVDGTVAIGSMVSRHRHSDGKRDYLDVRFVCVSKKRPAEQYDNVLMQVSLFRYRKGGSPEDFRKNAKKAVYGDFEKLYSDFHLFTMETAEVREYDGSFLYYLDSAFVLNTLPQIEDGVYMVGLDLGGARMYKDAKWGVYGFFPEPEEENEPDPIEESKTFVPFEKYVEKYHADPSVQKLIILSSELFRGPDPYEGYCLCGRFLCRYPEKAPDAFEKIPSKVTMRRLKKDIPFETFQRNAAHYTEEDFDEVEDSQCLVTLRTDRANCDMREDGSVLCYMDMEYYELSDPECFEDGIYAIEMEIGGARMHRSAKWGVYAFYGEERSAPAPAPGGTAPAPAPGPADSGRSGARTAEHPDTRDYFEIPVDLERFISLGSDPRVREMRMEYYEVTITPGAVVFHVAVNSRKPLPVGGEMTVWCDCSVTAQQKKLLGKKVWDIVYRGNLPSPLKQAKILPRDDYEYDDAYGYFLEITFMGDELLRNPIPGYYNVRFSIETAEYLRKGHVLFNRFHVDKLE